MDPHLRQVTHLPLSELWNDSGTIDATRLRDVGQDEIRELLRLGTAGVIANLGDQLKWLGDTDLFAWWKVEARPRLVPPALESLYLEDFPDERCWTASEWRLADGATAILFESWH